MNKIELYQEILKIAPYRSNQSDYRAVLSEVLAKYRALLGELDSNQFDPNQSRNGVLKDVDNTIEKLKEIAKNSFKGFPSTAYIQLSNLLKTHRANLIWNEIQSETPFYRMRHVEGPRINLGYKQMFHVPISKRGLVKTQRYSTPGYPCLYLGESIYGCWEEMQRPVMSQCWVSLLKNQRAIELLDLRIPTVEQFIRDFSRYTQVFPLIIACMIPALNSDDVYKPEYIVPQLIFEWIIKNQKYGIYYTSSHKNGDFDFPTDKFNNLAIPVKQPLAKTDYCPTIARDFKISNPLNNEIEQLRESYTLDAGVYGNEENVQEELNRNYNTSDFGQLERRLVHYDDLHLMNE